MSDQTNQARKDAYLARYRQIDRAGILDIFATIQAVADSGTLNLRTEAIPWTEYESYLSETDYPTRYPAYIKEFGTGRTFRSKALEHFLSFRLLGAAPGESVMDVASSNSPCADIMKRNFQVKQAWRQDFNYPQGVQGEKVGSAASRIPLPDHSVDMMMLHNSWEHFEGDEDIGFLFEAQRLLTRVGRLIIIPLFMSPVLEVWTSPSVWEGKYKAAPTTPAFDPRAVIVKREDLKQRQVKRFDVASLVQDVSHLTKLRFEFVYFENYNEEEFGFPFALFAVRK